MLRLAGSVMAAAVAVVPVTRASGATTSPVDTVWSGCDEAVLGAVVDAANLDGQLPTGWQDHFTPDGADGKALLAVVTAKCADLVTDGRDLGPMTFSGVMIHVTPTKCAGGNDNWLDAWWSTDSAAFAKRMNALGHRTIVDREQFALSTTGVLETVTGGSSWHTSPWSVTATGSTPEALPGNPFDTDHWGLGKYGTVQFVERDSGAAAGAAEGSLQTPAGTPLSSMLGGQADTTVAGLTAHFDGVSGDWTVVDC